MGCGQRKEVFALQHSSNVSGVAVTLPRAVVPSCHCGCVVRAQKSGLSRCYTASVLSVLSVHIHIFSEMCFDYTCVIFVLC